MLDVPGYSLDGTLGRYIVGVLDSQRPIDRVALIDFANIAAPNIGVLRYPSLSPGLAYNIGPFPLSRTGQHFHADDDWSDSEPFLEAMNKPGGPFYDGLAKSWCGAVTRTS